jgi:hypothetical protein
VCAGCFPLVRRKIDREETTVLRPFCSRKEPRARRGPSPHRGHEIFRLIFHKQNQQDRELKPSNRPTEINELPWIRLTSFGRRGPVGMRISVHRGELREGDWVQLSIAPKDTRPRPIVFHSQLRANGYTEQSRGSLFAVEVLF